MAKAVYRADSSLVGKLRRRLARLSERKPAPTPAGGMVTFSFDDAPLSAAQAGAALLEAKGWRGTYFISAGLAGKPSAMGRIADLATVRALAERGHEIACHTLSHLDCGRAGQNQINDEIAANRQAFATAGIAGPTTFAYPYGDVSLAAKRALGPRFSLARALHHGLIEGGVDLNQAPAVGIEGEDGEAIATRWLEAAKARKAWLILYTHDVRDRPSEFGCTPAALERLIARAGELGLDVVTAAEGARRLGQG